MDDERIGILWWLFLWLNAKAVVTGDIMRHAAASTISAVLLLTAVKGTVDVVLCGRLD